MTDLEKKYKAVCMEYITTFSTKHNIPFEGWINNTVGGVAYFGDYAFNFQDIVWDINSSQPPHVLTEWIEHWTSGGDINYYTFTKLART